jgi:hypothetical protein
MPIRPIELAKTMVNINKTYMANWLGPKHLASKVIDRTLTITKKKRPLKYVIRFPKNEVLSDNIFTINDHFKKSQKMHHILSSYVLSRRLDDK